MKIFETQNLIKNYQEDHTTTPVLKGINLSINAGETVAIVGASGAGKSTLLHILGTLDRPTSGSVFFEGNDFSKMNERDLSDFRNQTLGFIFQFHHLLPDFNALENISMSLLIRGERRKECHRRSREMLERVGLFGKDHHRPAELSGGEQQRVALARALIGSPRVLLADEPTGNLDGPTGEQVFDLLLTFNKEIKTTLIVVTHNENLSRHLQRTVKLIDGKIQTL